MTTAPHNQSRTTLKPDQRSASHHIKLLTGRKNAKVMFQVFSDKKGAGRKAWCKYGRLRDVWKDLIEAQKEGCGVYVTINETDGRGRKSQNIARILALAVDLDGTPLPLRYQLPPHLVTQSVNRRSNLTPHRRPILTPLSDGFWR